MIVHGSDDWLVPQPEVCRLADAFPKSPHRIEVPGAGHSNVVGTGGEQLVRRIVEFLSREADDVADTVKGNRRERTLHDPAPQARELEEMANDPAIQRELREIDEEFRVAEFDGLD
jgi:hypothetical protein